MKTNGAVDISFYAFSAIAIGGDEWSTSTPFCPRLLQNCDTKRWLPLDRLLLGIQSRYGHNRLENNLLRRQGIEPRFQDHSVGIYRLSYLSPLFVGSALSAPTYFK
jgi:hypothetical protein